MGQVAFFLLQIIALALGQFFVVQTTFSSLDTTCTSPRAIDGNQAPSCTPTPCTCGGGICVTGTCFTLPNVPQIPASMVGFRAYSASTCTGTLIGIDASLDGVCVNTGGSTSKRLSCANNVLSRTTWSGTSACSGTGSSSATSNTCTSVSGQSIVSNCPASGTSGTTTTTGGTSSPATGSSNSCFHKDTVITYNGKEFTLEELRSSQECSIPHLVRATGVLVTAKCSNKERTLRLTDGHLVYTQRGLVPARDLKPGHDTVFADIEEKVKCEIARVTKEGQSNDYFGLNCLNSQVLAGGLKASTFERLHALPALWMHLAGHVFGIKRASHFGNFIAEVALKLFEYK